MAILSIGMMAASSALGVSASLQQGKQAEKIAERRAYMDKLNADAALRRADVQAKMKLQEGRRLLASQKAGFAASGVNVNMGSPLVVAAQTKADILRDVNYIYEGGDADRRRYEASAENELAMGKHMRHQSKYAALGRGLRGGSKFLQYGVDEWGWFT